MVAFQTPSAAAAWAMDIQEKLLRIDWPEDIFEHRSGTRVAMPASDGEASIGSGTSSAVAYLFRGLRVRMGIHTGIPELEYNSRTQVRPVCSQTRNKVLFLPWTKRCSIR